MTSRETDAELEGQIVIAYHQAMASGKREYWIRLSALMAKRSAEQVRKMEQQRGLSGR
jgi:hypothetical protein